MAWRTRGWGCPCTFLLDILYLLPHGCDQMLGLGSDEVTAPIFRMDSRLPFTERGLAMYTGFRGSSADRRRFSSLHPPSGSPGRGEGPQSFPWKGLIYPPTFSFCFGFRRIIAITAHAHNPFPQTQSEKRISVTLGAMEMIRRAGGRPSPCAPNSSVKDHGQPYLSQSEQE